MEVVMINKLMSNENFEIAIVMIKDIMRETKKAFTGEKLPHQGLKFLLIYYSPAFVLYNPRKKNKTLRSSDVFRGYRKATPGRNRLMML